MLQTSQSQLGRWRHENGEKVVSPSTGVYVSADRGLKARCKGDTCLSLNGLVVCKSRCLWLKLPGRCRSFTMRLSKKAREKKDETVTEWLSHTRSILKICTPKMGKCCKPSKIKILKSFLLKSDMWLLSSLTGPSGVDYWAIVLVSHRLCVWTIKSVAFIWLSTRRGELSWPWLLSLDMKKIRCCSLLAVAALLFYNVLAGKKCRLYFSNIHILSSPTWVLGSRIQPRPTSKVPRRHYL